MKINFVALCVSRVCNKATGHGQKVAFSPGPLKGLRYTNVSDIVSSIQDRFSIHILDQKSFYIDYSNYTV